MPMPRSCSIASRDGKRVTTVMPTPPGRSVISTRMTMVGMVVLGAPVSSAKPSSITSRRGGSASSTFHHPCGWSPSGPVM